MSLLDDLKALKENGAKDVPMNQFLQLCKKHKISLSPKDKKEIQSKAKLKPSPGNARMQFYHLSNTAAQKLAKSIDKSDKE